MPAAAGVTRSTPPRKRFSHARVVQAAKKNSPTAPDGKMGKEGDAMVEASVEVRRGVRRQAG